MPRSAGEFLADMHQSQHAEMLAGGLMSRGAAVGAPLFSGIAGMMGADPMSLGMRAGMGMWNAGAGVLGAGMAGMGVMAGAGIVGGAASFAGGQMMSGAHQQQQLNQSLRGFNFMNNQGGQGFTSNQGFQIGSTLRGMTHEQGPAGEVRGFDELSRLASNMGRMGMTQGVKTVSDFKDKLKEGMKAWEQIAKDLSTSLEEAQKMTVSMKNSGVFRTIDQVKMSGSMRTGAMAGGIAMSEMSAMGNIGSQISRSVGGLGGAGAFGGMKTIAQIGVAQQVGAISEEDIYNATGLTGADGRQALATSQMQQSARFMSSGRGRRFLASVAGKDGHLNQEAVSEWMSGGNMSTGRTMELAQKNLGGVGRANFIRNEGRLRGAALEQFGGLAQSMVYKQWLGSRGMDADNMDDRSMLAFQRFSGMGRDEADVAVKQMQAMPEMVREFNESKRGQNHSDNLSKYRNTHGIQGLKHQFDQKREHVQGMFQQAGARILQEGTESLESWFNGVMGAYVDLSTEGIDKIAANLERGGGASAKAQYRRFFGGAKGAAGGTGALAQQFQKGAKNQMMQFSAMGGTGDKDILAFGEGNSEFVKLASLAGQGQSSDGAMGTFREQLAKRAAVDPKAAAVLEKFDKATPGQKAGMMQGMQDKAGVAKEGNILSNLSRPDSASYGGNGGSAADYEKELGRTLMGKGNSDFAKFSDAGMGSKLAGGTIGFLAMMGGATFGGLNDDEAMAAGDRATQRATAAIQDKYEGLTGGSDRSRAMARVFTGKTQGMVSDMFAGGADAVSARSDAMDHISKLRGNKKFGELSDGDKGSIEGLAGASMASKYGDAIDEYSKNGKSDSAKDILDEYKKMTGNGDISEGDLMKNLSAMKSGGAGALAKQSMENFKHDFKRLTDNQASDKDAAVRMGMATYDKDGKLQLSTKASGDRKGMSKEALAADDLGLGLLNYDLAKPSDEAIEKHMQSMGKTREDYDKMSDDEKNSHGMLAAHAEYYGKTQEQYDKIGSLSMAEKKKLAKSRAGSKTGDIAAYEIQLEDRFTSASKGKGGELGAVSKMLGMNLSDEQMAGLKGGSTQEQVAKLLGAGGFSDKNLEADLTKALGAGSKGGKAQGISAAIGNMSDESKRKLQDSKASQDDPNFRVMNELKAEAGKQTSLLKLIAQQKPASPEDIAALVGGGAEGKGNKPGQTP